MASWPDFRPTELLGELVQAGVDFVVIGGVAVVAQANPRFTKDLDICYSSEPGNLARLGNLMTRLRARFRGIDEDLPFFADARTLRGTTILTLATDLGNIDLFVEPSGSPPYPKLRERADVMEIAGVNVSVASVTDLLAMKRAADRPQDRIDVEALEIARRRRGQRSGP